MPVCADLGCNYVQFNLCSTASTIAGVLFSVFLAGKLSAGKTRYWMLVGGVAAGICIFLMGNTSNIWLIIMLFGVGNFAFCAITYVPINVLIANWFVDKRAMATSIVMSGLGIGGMIFTPVATKMINASWRNAYHITGIIVTTVALTVTWFLKKPQEMNLTPLILKKSVLAEEKKTPTWAGLTKAEALKTGAFYMYALFCICCGMIAAGVSIQLPTFFTESGLDYASRMSIYNFSSLIGLLVMGRVIDKLGIKAGGTLAGGLLIAAMICLVFVPRFSFVSYLAVILNPLGGCITSLGPPLLAGQTFGMKEYGGIYGLGHTCFSLGCLIGPLLASTLRTVSGNYMSAWIIFAIVAVVMIFSVFTCTSAGKKLQKNDTINT